MEACPPQLQTPKRKRGQSGVSSGRPLLLSLDTSASARALLGDEEGAVQSSPRSAMAHKLGGLMLEGRAAVAAEDADKDVDMDAEPTQKRLKQDHHVMQHAMPPQMQMQMQMQMQTTMKQQQQQQQPGAEPQPGELSSEGDSSPQTQGLAAKEAEEAIPKVRKRAGTPPLLSRKHRSPGVDADDDDEPVDPVRAALTWTEDEITVYDPNDEDDDGTGVNGLGFKPSAALAQSRIMKRRQQMAEYRRREDNDARAKRSQRRRGEVPSARRDSNKSPPRRVRFMDLDSINLAVKTV